VTFVEGVVIEIVATLALGAAVGIIFWLRPASGTTTGVIGLGVRLSCIGAHLGASHDEQ
jgi:hypothetical protein